MCLINWSAQPAVKAVETELETMLKNEGTKPAYEAEPTLKQVPLC